MCSTVELALVDAQGGTEKSSTFTRTVNLTVNFPANFDPLQTFTTAIFHYRIVSRNCQAKICTN